MIIIHRFTLKIWYNLVVESNDMKKIIVVKKTKDDTSDAKYWSKPYVLDQNRAKQPTTVQTRIPNLICYETQSKLVL